MHVFDFSFRYVYLIAFCLFDAVSTVSDCLFNEVDNWASYDALLKTKKAIVKHEKKIKLENSAVFNSPIPIGHVDLVSPEQSEDSQSFGKKTPVQTTPGSKTAAATPGSVASDEPAEDEMRRTHNIPKDNYPFPGDFIEATDPRPVQTQGPLRSRYRSIWVQGSHVLQKQYDTYRIKLGGMSKSRHNTLQAACEVYAKLAGYPNGYPNAMVDVTSDDEAGAVTSGGDDAGASGGNALEPDAADDDAGASGGNAPEPSGGDDAGASGGNVPEPSGGDDAGTSGNDEASDESPSYQNPADLPPTKRAKYNNPLNIR